jgi:hypothetical protein
VRIATVVLVCALSSGCRQDRAASAAPPSPAAAPTAASAPSGAPSTGSAPPSLACAGMEGCVSACTGTPDSCARLCADRLSAPARPYYDALQACVAPACAAGDAGSAACQQPSSLACKLCVMSHCPKEAAACIAH